MRFSLRCFEPDTLYLILLCAGWCSRISGCAAQVRNSVSAERARNTREDVLMCCARNVWTVWSEVVLGVGGLRGVKRQVTCCQVKGFKQRKVRVPTSWKELQEKSKSIPKNTEYSECTTRHTHTHSPTWIHTLTHTHITHSLKRIQIVQISRTTEHFSSTTETPKGKVHDI